MSEADNMRRREEDRWCELHEQMRRDSEQMDALWAEWERKDAEVGGERIPGSARPDELGTPSKFTADLSAHDARTGLSEPSYLLDHDIDHEHRMGRL